MTTPIWVWHDVKLVASVLKWHSPGKSEQDIYQKERKSREETERKTGWWPGFDWVYRTMEAVEGPTQMICRGHLSVPLVNLGYVGGWGGLKPGSPIYLRSERTTIIKRRRIIPTRVPGKTWLDNQSHTHPGIWTAPCCAEPSLNLHPGQFCPVRWRVSSLVRGLVVGTYGKGGNGRIITR